MRVSPQPLRVWILILAGILGTAVAGPSRSESKGILRDTHDPIRIVIPPTEEKRHGPVFLIPIDDTAAPATAVTATESAPALKPPVPDKNPGLGLPPPPDLVLPWLTLTSPFSLTPVESLSVQAKTIRDFPKYWAQWEAHEGLDDLRQQLGMPTTSGASMGIRLPGLYAANGKLGLNVAWIGSSLWQAWHKMALEREKQNAFEAKVNGLMGYAQDLGTRKNSGPAISLIVARLDFMKKKVAGKLPTRSERLAFTEPLKAWAVNPVFDSTLLGPSLLNICGLYEEMTN